MASFPFQGVLGWRLVEVVHVYLRGPDEAWLRLEQLSEGRNSELWTKLCWHAHRLPSADHRGSSGPPRKGIAFEIYLWEIAPSYCLDY